MKLSVVIPARNEEGAIADTVMEIAPALEDEGAEYELIVVDDGSTDQTATRVRAAL